MEGGCVPYFLLTLVLSLLSSRNAQDWAFMRMESERKGFKIDYVTLKAKQIVLTLTWSALVIASVSRLAYSLNAGENFWQFLVQ